MKVLALLPCPINIGPSQRFRLGIYLDYLDQEGIEVECHSFYDEKMMSILYSEGLFFKKTTYVLLGFWKKIKLLFSLRKFSMVYVQREITPIGPPIFAWIISRLFRKKMVFDFDDAIWMPNYTKANAKFHKLKSYWKTKYLIKWSSTVLAGNAFLKDYALKYNSNVKVMPTSVDTLKMHNPKLFDDISNTDIPIIGWTGSVSTLVHFETVIPILDELAKTYKFKVIVISNIPPKDSRSFLEFKEWNTQTEIKDLLEFDLGIMPLKEDSEFAKGKCGFKIIQFMALSKTVLASPIGVNSKIISHGKNGYICKDEDDWRNYLETFLQGKLKDTGKGARAHIEEKYSVNATLKYLIDALKN